jgi:hypothetical protein
VGEERYGYGRYSGWLNPGNSPETAGHVSKLRYIDSTYAKGIRSE